MEERDKCKIHINQEICLICIEEGCNEQPLCPKCVPTHRKHTIEDMDQYWKDKIQHLGDMEIMKRELKEPIDQEEGNILLVCRDMKNYILDWGRKLQVEMTKSVNKDVKAMIKMINNYENKMISNIQETHLDLNKIIENGNQNKKYKKKMKKALNRNKFSIINTYYKDLTKMQKGTKDIMQKMKEKQKNKRPEVVMKEIKSKTEKGVKSLFEHINQLIKTQEVNLKELEGIFKKVEEKKEKTPKEHIFQGIISASDDKSLILWDKEYKQKSTHKGKSWYSKLIELSSGRIAATTGDPENSVEILGNNLELLSTLRGHTNHIYDICNMGERNIITGSMDNTVRMWDLRSGECSQILIGHTGWVYCVHLHSKSGYLLTGSVDHTVRIWDITNTPQSYKEIAQIYHQGEYTYVWDLVELDDGRMLSICGEYYGQPPDIGVKVWELRGKTTTTIKDIPLHKQEKRGFRCGLGISDTKGVLLGGFEGNLMLFDVGSYVLSPLIHNLHQGRILQIKGLKDDIYVTCSHDKSIKIVNVVTKKVLQTLLGHTDWVYSILPIFTEE